jgi:transcription initiation factor TFIID subunit TAF12
MEELQKLYDVLVREGKYSKSFEEFQAKWAQDQAYKEKVYNVVTRDGLYSKDKDSFLRKYTATEQPIKKKVSSELPKPQAERAATTALPSADGSLATPRTKKKVQPKEEKNERTCYCKRT